MHFACQQDKERRLLSERLGMMPPSGKLEKMPPSEKPEMMPPSEKLDKYIQKS
jgi:hypothetical protein